MDVLRQHVQMFCHEHAYVFFGGTRRYLQLTNVYRNISEGHNPDCAVSALINVHLHDPRCYGPLNETFCNQAFRGVGAQEPPLHTAGKITTREL